MGSDDAIRGGSEILKAGDDNATVRQPGRHLAAALARTPLERLADPGELALVKKIAQWPRLVEAAAAAHEPHRLAFYLHDLASEFHSHWNSGTEMPHLRFIIEDDAPLTSARLTLVYGVVLVLASGLAILGVGAPEEMR